MLKRVHRKPVRGGGGGGGGGGGQAGATKWVEGP